MIPGQSRRCIAKPKLPTTECATASIALQQRGVALVVALIFLLFLTILGVTVMQTSSLEGRMAANTQEANRAFEAAQSAVDYAMSDDSQYVSLTKGSAPLQWTLPSTFGGSMYQDMAAKITAEITDVPRTLPRPKDPRLISNIDQYTGSVYMITAEIKSGLSKSSALTAQGFVRATPKQGNN